MKNLELFVGATYQFDYTNHRGETENRTATFRDFQITGHETVEYYPAGTHCFYMEDHMRNAPRSFAIANIDFDTWRKI